jgi:nucleoside-diphosphate-sugar epimerase
MSAPRLFCFGLGYSATVLARRLAAQGWRIAGTTTSPARRDELATLGFTVEVSDRATMLADAASLLAGTTHLLSSVPPDDAGDPVLDVHRAAIAALPLAWAGYLSTTGVYGDTGGAIVDETAPLRPTGARGRRRVAAEAAWRALAATAGPPLHIFRLAGIYGPGRSALDAVRAGAAKRIAKPGQLFSRIHVEDIASVLEASMARPRPGAVYNVCDDDPAPPAAVTEYACALLGAPLPPVVSLEEAGLSPMARSFWDDNRRVDNSRLKRELGVALRYQDYRSGLRAILQAGG